MSLTNLKLSKRKDGGKSMEKSWPFERIAMLFTGLALLMITLQVAIFHYRQNFRHPAMWLPVLGGPTLGAVLILNAFFRSPLLKTITTIFLFVGLIEGMIGTFYHVRGIGQRVNGYRLENVLVGPPVVLPVMISAMSILGLLALYWRW